MHVARRTCPLRVTVDLDVKRGDKLRVAQLPDVHMVTTNHSWQIFDVGLDFIDGHASRHCLQEDATSSLAEWDGRC